MESGLRLLLALSQPVREIRKNYTRDKMDSNTTSRMSTLEGQLARYNCTEISALRRLPLTPSLLTTDGIFLDHACLTRKRRTDPLWNREAARLSKMRMDLPFLINQHPHTAEQPLLA
jgi:hypothetical protein